MHNTIWTFVALALILYLVRYVLQTDTPFIKGLTSIPGLPVVGNLFQLGDSHALNAQQLAKKYGPVFQVRLGNKRIVFANTFASVRHFWITHQSALISRPIFYTFHGKLSSTQGFTIGTSAWDESCKRRRKAAATALNKPAVQSYMDIIDEESTASIRELIRDCKSGEVDVDPGAYCGRYALNTSLELAYGYRVESLQSELLKEIAHVERVVSNIRSTSNNWQDYIPILRLAFWSTSNTNADEYRVRRDKYMTDLLDILKQKIADGTDQPCIIGNILKDPEAKLNEIEVKSVCLTMVSAGLDTVPGNLVMGLAYLASAPGQAVQQRIWDELQKTYPNGDAWHRVTSDIAEIPYIVAFVKEILRFWSVIAICLPRTSIADIEWEGAVIPKGTTFYMVGNISDQANVFPNNAYAANYDSEHFDDPYSFIPERYLAPSSHAGVGTPHYGYGAGSRMCAGSHLANRELYVAFARIVLTMHLVEAKLPSDRPIMDALQCSRLSTGLTTDPKPFKIGIKPRDGWEACIQGEKMSSS